MNYVDSCIRSIDVANQHLENARVAYVQHLFRRCNAQVIKASDHIYDIISHPELIDDDIHEVINLARAFSNLNIPFLTSTGITYIRGVICYPECETFATLYFYIFNVGKCFLEHTQVVQRISGKKAV